MPSAQCVLVHSSVTAIYMLGKPVVGVAKGTHATTMLPAGAVVEFFQTSHTVGLIEVHCEGHSYAVFLNDLLDACRTEDTGHIG